MPREQLTKGLNLRISPGEMTMLDELSEATGLTKGAVVRQLIRRERAKLDAKPRTARNKKR